MINIKRFKRVLSSLTTFILVVISLILVGLRVIGYTPFTIASSSMYPTYKKGDLVYTKKISLSDLNEGDTIAFIANEDLLLITHRVVEIDEKNKLIYTKGDNNATSDYLPVKYEDILGRVEFKIPYVGHITSYFKSDSGKYVFVGLVVILVVLLLKPEKRKE